MPRAVYFILELSGAVFISKIKIEESEIMRQFKTVRYFLNHVVWNYRNNFWKLHYDRGWKEKLLV